MANKTIIHIMHRNTHNQKKTNTHNLHKDKGSLFPD